MIPDLWLQEGFNVPDRDRKTNATYYSGPQILDCGYQHISLQHGL